jgi:hypothetical protein
LRARGVVGCTLVRYRRQEGNGHRFGVVFLVVYLFDDVARASAALPQFTNDYLARARNSDVVSKHSLAVTALGDEAPRGMRFVLGRPGEESTALFTYLWRRDQAVAVLAIGDERHDFDHSDALALARRIDQRATS